MNRVSLFAVLLMACARSPQPTFYALTARDGRTHPGAAGVIEVRTPHLPGYLDRHELVLGLREQRLELASDARWAEPVAPMLARVLASNLAQRLPHAQVLTNDGHVRAEPLVRVELNVQRFERDAQGKLLLEALVALHVPGSTAGVIRQVALHDATSRQGADDLVRGMSALTAQLADQLASVAMELLMNPTAPSVSSPTRSGAAR
jgi:uncharacterized lipoprotein YmbA